MHDRILSPNEYNAFIDMLDGKPFDRRCFEKAATKIRFGSALRPDGMSILGRGDVPDLPKEFRQDAEWSRALVDRHQKAAWAAWELYWRIMNEPADA